MRLLDRYLLREFLIPLSYCLGGFYVFWIFFNLLSELEELKEDQMGLGDMLQYFIVLSPKFLVVVLPIALLLALLYSLTHLSRHNEITAIRAAGISMWRLSAPYLAIGLMVSIGLLGVNEWWAPECEELAQEIRSRHRTGSDAVDRYTLRNVQFINHRDHRKWTIGEYHAQRQELKQTWIYWRLADGKLRAVLADRAQWTNGNWVFYNPMIWHYEAGPERIPEPQPATNRIVFQEITETPEIIRSEIKITNLSGIKAAKRPQLSLREIINYLHLHPNLAAPKKAMLSTQFHGRLAEAWTCLVVVMIALPFGAPSGRRNVFAGVASSIFIAFIYFILLRLGLVLGTSGMVWPWLGAWLPNIVFATLGIWATCRIR